MSFLSQILQDTAADADYRTTCIDEKWWETIDGHKALYKRYGEGEGIWVDIRMTVCPACEGRGKYVNPSIDAHGLTAEDFDEDPEFEENYFGGLYDIICKLCNGNNVIPVPTNSDILDEITGDADERYQYRMEQLAEIRAGC